MYMKGIWYYNTSVKIDVTHINYHFLNFKIMDFNCYALEIQSNLSMTKEIRLVGLVCNPHKTRTNNKTNQV